MTYGDGRAHLAAHPIALVAAAVIVVAVYISKRRPIAIGDVGQREVGARRQPDARRRRYACLARSTCTSGSPRRARRTCSARCSPTASCWSGTACSTPVPSRRRTSSGSLDLRGTTFKGHVYDGLEGAWARLVAQADAFDGNTLISHETLAHAKPEHIERAVTASAPTTCGSSSPARDLARQIPAVWQESSRTAARRRTTSSWRRSSRPGGASREVAGGFWGAQDVGGVVGRWGAAVGVDRVMRRDRAAERRRPARALARFAQATEPARHRLRRSPRSATTRRSGSPRPSCCGGSTRCSRTRSTGRSTTRWSSGGSPRACSPAGPRARPHGSRASGSQTSRTSPRRQIGAAGGLRRHRRGGPPRPGGPAVESQAPATQPSDLTDTELLDVSLQVVARLTLQRTRDATGRTTARRSVSCWSPRTVRQAADLVRGTVRRRFGSREHRRLATGEGDLRSRVRSRCWSR